MNEQAPLNPFQEEVSPEEPRDRTKLIWLGIALLLLVMMFFLYRDRSVRPLATSVRARHILVSFDTTDPVERGRAYERISDIRARIVAGESFERLARNHSDDSVSARRGGDLGWAPRDSYAAAFEEFCWHGAVGEVSDIIQTTYGFHLVLVEDRHIADADLYEIEIERRAFEELQRQQQE